MKKFSLTIALAGIAVMLNAQSLQFLGIPSDARSTALAGASVALDAGAMAAEVNAAASVLSSSKLGAGLNYSLWGGKPDEIRLTSAGMFYNFGKMSLGIAGRYCLEGKYDRYSGNGRYLGEFAPSELSVAMCGAFRLGNHFGLGATARLIRSRLGMEADAGAFNADFSLMYSKGILKAGLAVCNIGPKIRYGDVERLQPSLARAGLSVSAGALVGCLELDTMFAGGLAAGIAVEYTIADIVSMRAGYHFGSGDAMVIPSYGSLGLGLKLAWASLNATYLPGSKTPGGTWCFGMVIAFPA